MPPRRPIPEGAKDVLRNLGSKIHQRRTELGISLEGLAASTGLSVRAIERLEDGELDVPLDRLGRLAQALEIDAAELLKP